MCSVCWLLMCQPGGVLTSSQSSALMCWWWGEAGLTPANMIAPTQYMMFVSQDDQAHCFVQPM